jgi:hypothetical protein
MTSPASDVHVNGRKTHLGIRVLRDRDEIRLGGDRIYFSTERTAHVESFAGDAGSAACPRCQQPLTDGAAVVRCPQCSAAHHQDENLPCWCGYEKEPFETCALCDQPAGLDRGYRWTPEGL